MAVPSGENIYDTYGTILYRVISEERHAAEMTGISALEDENTETANATHNKTAHNDFGATSDFFSPVQAQKNVMTAAAASFAASSKSTRKKPSRLDPISNSIKPTTVADTFVDPNKKTTTDPTAPSGPYRLTVEKALAQFFTPFALDNEDENNSASDNESSRNKSKVDENWLKVAAIDHISRLDVVQLFQHLQRRCVEEHARPRGLLCPTREAIFDEGMKEVMRQVTVSCPERGLLLNDLAMQMSQNTITYDVLAENASQYAVRKGTERDLRSYLFDEEKELESEVRRIENRVNELQAKYNGLQKRFQEQKESNQKVREEEIAYIKKANQQIINEIKRLSNLEATSAT